MLDEPLAGFIFIAATGYGLWWLYKRGGGPGSCVEGLLALAFAGGFGILVVLGVSLIAAVIGPIVVAFLNWEFR